MASDSLYTLSMTGGGHTHSIAWAVKIIFKQLDLSQIAILYVPVFLKQ